MGSLFAGPSAVLRALALLGSRAVLIPPILIPAIAALGLSVAGIWAAMAYGPELLAWAWPEPAGGFAYAVWWLTDWLVRISGAVVSLVFTPWLIMLVGLPLCEPLVGRAEAVLGDPPADTSLWGDLARTLTTTIGLVALGVTGAIAFFILGLLPGVGIITVPFVAFVWTPLFLALDLCDSSLGRRGYNLRRKLRFMANNPLRMLSLGLTSMLLVAIPGVNLLGLPIAVLAGVIVVRDRVQPKT